MLYQFTYPEGHELEVLNNYLVEFINNLRVTNDRSRFVVTTKYFNEQNIPVVNGASELKTKYKNFFDAFKVLEVDAKDEFIGIINRAQNFENSFGDIHVNCIEFKTNNLIRILGDNSFKLLVDHLFGNLMGTRWDVKGHYDVIYRAMQHKICPFCGIEVMHSSFKEDYDHLAPKHLYPVATINPKNLAPMCNVCNTKAKTTTDVLYDGAGNRRTFVYPYTENIAVSFSCDGSIIPQTDIANDGGEWLITFNPDNEITRNWDNVFDIINRYVKDYISPSYETWLDDFVMDAVDDDIDLTDLDVLKAELIRMGNKWTTRWYQQANIIKGPLFTFFGQCDNKIFYNSIIKRYNAKLRALAA